MLQKENIKKTYSKTAELSTTQQCDTPETDGVTDDFVEGLSESLGMKDRARGRHTVEIDGQLYYDPDEEVDEEGKMIAEMERSFEHSLAFLDDMVGMEPVKQKLLRIGRYALWKRKQEAEGISTSVLPSPNLIFMFLGDPGTGKTTVARKMGEILHSAGLLYSEDVHVFRREDLVGQNYGCEEENTKAALQESRGAVLFLDEAYQCFRQSTDKRDPGYHILETLMQQFDRPGRCIIMAGYKSEMMEIFKVNPGFRSRIPNENIIEFTGPTEQMLVDVARNAFRKMRFHLTKGAASMLREHIHAMWVGKDKDFGNARVIRQMAESIVIDHANRVMTTTHADDFVITASDMRCSLSKLQVKAPARTRIGYV